jgi:hypothetical protein
VTPHSGLPDHEWEKTLPRKRMSAGTAILVDDRGNTTLTGFFRGTVFLGPTVITSATGTGLQGFLARLEPSRGDIIGGEQIPSSAWSTGITLARGPGGTTYVCGEFSGTATFGGTSLTGRGGGDAFVWNRGSAPE